MLNRVAQFVSLVAIMGAAAADAQNKCDAGKLKCIRQKVGCLIKVHETSQKKGSPPDAAKLQKCMDKFVADTKPPTGCFAKVEAKFPGECSTTSNAVTIEAQVDQDVQDYLDALSVTVPTTTSSTVASTTTTTTAPSLACGDPGDSTCSGSCPGVGTCHPDPILLDECSCTTTECELVVVDGAPLGTCVGNCGVSGGGCGCDGTGICAAGPCSTSLLCPSGYGCAIVPPSSQGLCVAGGCTSHSDCPSGGSCACEACTCQ